MRLTASRLSLIILAIVAFFTGITACVYAIVFLPVRSQSGTAVIHGLQKETIVAFDKYGVPHIHGESREDAFAALGYVSARDRLFQMDILRRKTAGRLAELFGADLVESDSFNRRMGFERLSSRILARLPAEQIQVLHAYAAGVNQAVRDTMMLPLEFTILRYRPEAWRPQDSLLVALNLAELAYTEEEERTASTMRAALPPEVVSFLTPETDCYNEVLAPGAKVACSVDSVPANEIAAILREEGARRASNLLRTERAPKGSNGWLVSGRLTPDGRAILANDMHLQLEIPNVWAQADLSYAGARVEGLYLPGLPMIVSGSNGHVSWGMTSVEGDFTDLVRFRHNPTDPERYIDENGESRAISVRRDRIEVRGESAVELLTHDTHWGPVSRPVLEEDVATRWTMLDDDATNLNLIEMDRIKTVAEALPLLRSAGVPPLNGLVADKAGDIGWTLMGKIPKRIGFDGLFAETWSATTTWDGFLSSDETPQRVNPPSGYLVNANQRMLPRNEFKPKLGHDYSGGYRAYAIDRMLAQTKRIDERSMAALQLNTHVEAYRFYQRLAIDALSDVSDDTHLRLRRALLAWDGRAEIESVGLPLIAEFRKLVMDAILTPLLARCRRLDPTFAYDWINADVPVQRLIETGRDDLLPPPYRDLRRFLREKLDQAAKRLEDNFGPPSDLRWGAVNRASIAHPLSAASPLLAWMLDMPRGPIAGCSQCIRLYQSLDGKSSGANARLVVSPGHEGDGLVQMVGGQSGQFGSSHFADQQAEWVAGVSHALRDEVTVDRLRLLPARRGVDEVSKDHL